MILCDIEIIKDNKKIIYFPYILTGAFKGISKSFTNKNKLKEYLQKENLQINKIIHINYNCNYAKIPF